jgi:dihydropteroate synthase
MSGLFSLRAYDSRMSKRSSMPVELSTTWSVAGRVIELSRPLIMGIVNVTPDSFSDGGRYFSPAAALAHGQRLIEEGADLLDIGGESTRPGAADVSEMEEIDRVLPLVEALQSGGVPISVDTSKPGVMRAALAAGAAVINDVRAFRTQGALEAVRGSGCGLVLMHMQGSPRTMQSEPQYDDVVADVTAFLRGRVADLANAGIDLCRIAIDPGFGFGKTVEHNFMLLRRLSALQAIGRPVLVGLSRKSLLGAITGRTVDDRVAASVAAAVLAVERGARIVRVHDVAATRDALKVWAATTGGQKG